MQSLGFRHAAFSPGLRVGSDWRPLLFDASEKTVSAASGVSQRRPRLSREGKREVSMAQAAHCLYRRSLQRAWRESPFLRFAWESVRPPDARLRLSSSLPTSLQRSPDQQGRLPGGVQTNAGRKEGISESQRRRFFDVVSNAALGSPSSGGAVPLLHRERLFVPDATARAFYQVVKDVDQYPLFIPWCQVGASRPSRVLPWEFVRPSPVLPPCASGQLCST